MKTRLLIVIIFAFLFNSVGFLLLFKVQQELNYKRVEKKIKKALKDNLPLEQLHYFEISKGSDLPSQAKWVKEKKEFRYQGKLYDVVRKIERSGKLYLACIDDKQERKLFEKLEEQVEENIADHSKNTSSNSSKIPKKAYDLYDLPNGIKFIFESNYIAFWQKSYALSEGFIRLSNPPPIFSF